jgi:hypothetical protein
MARRLRSTAAAFGYDAQLFQTLLEVRGSYRNSHWCWPRAETAGVAGGDLRDLPEAVRY